MKKPLWMVVWLLVIELLVVLLLVPGDRVLVAMKTESDLVKSYMGEEHYAWMERKAVGWHRTVLVDSGAISATYDHFIPTEEEVNKSKGMEKIGELWFEWVKGRIDAFSNTFYALSMRAAFILGWLPYIFILFFPAVFDGLMTWKIRQTNFDYVSPVIQTYSIRAVIVILFLIFIGMFLPIALHPVLIPIALMIISLLFGWSVSNLQKRI